MRRNVRCSAVLIASGALAASCGDPQNTKPAGATSGFAPVAGGSLVDYTNYTPTPFEPITPSVAAAGAAATPADAATEDVARQAETFVGEIAAALSRGEYRKALDSLTKDARTALADEKIASVASTFEMYALFRKLVGDKAGEAGVAALDAAWTNTPADGRKTTVVNANAVQVSPNPLAILLGPKIAGDSLTLERAAGVWSISLAAPPDDSAVAALGQFHAKVQAGLDGLSDALNALPPEAAAALASGPLMKDVLAPAIGKVLLGEEIPVNLLSAAAPGAASDPTATPGDPAANANTNAAAGEGAPSGEGAQPADNANKNDNG